MRNMYVDTTYTPTPFVDGVYRIKIEQLGELYFSKPIELNGTMFLEGRFAETDRKMLFKKKAGKPWPTADGKRETWFTHTDGGTFGEPMNIIVKAELRFDDDGKVTWFWPKEVWLARHEARTPAPDPSDAFIPKQRDINEVVRRTLKNADEPVGVREDDDTGSDD